MSTQIRRHLGFFPLEHAPDRTEVVLLGLHEAFATLECTKPAQIRMQQRIGLQDGVEVVQDLGRWTIKEPWGKCRWGRRSDATGRDPVCF